MKFPLGAMSVGDILDRGLKLLLARLPLFYLINLIILSPVIIFELALPVIFDGVFENLEPSSRLAMGCLLVLAGVLQFLLQPIATGAIVHIVMQQYVGKRATIGEAFSLSLSWFGNLLGVAILVGLMFLAVVTICCFFGFCIMGMFAVAAIGGAAAMGGGAGVPIAILVLYIVVFILCLAPAVYVLAMFVLAPQSILVEKLGVGEALQRSFSLTSNYRWKAFGVLLLIFFAQYAVVIPLNLGLHHFLPPETSIPTDDGVANKLNVLNHFIDVAVRQLALILFYTFFAVTTTLLYLDLRIRKEGFDLELAALHDEEPDDDRDRDRDEGRDEDEYDERDDDRDRRDDPR